MNVCMLGQRRIQRPYLDDLQASLPRVQQPPDRGRIGMERVCTPDQEAFCVWDVRRTEVPIVQLHSHCRSLEAGARFGAVVWRAEAVGQTLQERPHPLRIAGKESNRLGSGLFLDPEELLCN